jgi:hypothetical protein
MSVDAYLDISSRPWQVECCMFRACSISHEMKGCNKSGLDSFNNYYKFWRFGINPWSVPAETDGPLMDLS